MLVLFQASLAVDEVYSPSGANSKKKNDLTISENYAFTGVHHIFDQVTKSIRRKCVQIWDWHGANLWVTASLAERLPYRTAQRSWV